MYYKPGTPMSQPSLSNPITLRLPEDVLDAIERIAETCDRTRSWVMVRAMKQYLAQEGAEILAVREGRKEVAAGDVHDMDGVLDELEIIANRRVA